ncbi:CPBP family intramembrane glutamic endopeptidase [Dysgonomonas sp. ZJ709]|uniref:CPBP family intramembrane glutamic endopeptidase n=1 Tax=Dysgonomonas sp. ZJ709 TaxID=2709797 RepID=UPI0013EC6328|nr:CPBP family intramembrane glutamic endopeptidase [Dysgonomonas sp. ZJ709]
MINKEIFYRMGGWSQLLFLSLLTILGLMIGIVLISITSLAFAQEDGIAALSQSISFLKTAQVVQTVSIFIIPAFIFAYLFKNDPMSFLRINIAPGYKFVLLALTLIVAVQPILQLTSYYNQQISFPESLSTIENWMREKEDGVKKIIEMFLADKSISGILTNLFIIAVLAGIAEELFFRGCLQQIIKKIVSNKHIAIWITAIIFSTIHFQFYGFFPRMIAGALLGYLFLWTGNLWIPIIAHTIHNAINLILSQIYFGTPQYDNMEYMGIEDHKWLALVSVIVCCAIIYIFVKRGRQIQNTNTSLS